MFNEGCLPRRSTWTKILSIFSVLNNSPIGTSKNGRQFSRARVREPVLKLTDTLPSGSVLRAASTIGTSFPFTMPFLFWSLSVCWFIAVLRTTTMFFCDTSTLERPLHRSLPSSKERSGVPWSQCDGNNIADCSLNAIFHNEHSPSRDFSHDQGKKSSRNRWGTYHHASKTELWNIFQREIEMRFSGIQIVKIAFNAPVPRWLCARTLIA